MGALGGITSCAGRAALQEHTFALIFPLAFQFQSLGSRPCTTATRGASPSPGRRPRCGPGRGERPAGSRSATAAQVLPQPVAMGTAGGEVGGNVHARSPLAASGREGRVCACVCARVPEVLRCYYRNRRGEAVAARPHPLPLPLPVPSMPARALHAVTERRRSRAAMGRGEGSGLAPAPPCLRGLPAAPAALRPRTGAEKKKIMLRIVI